MWGVVGVGEREERVYEALVKRRHAGAADLAKELDMSSGHTGRLLARLADLGLATRHPGRPPRFAAVSPDHVAASLIARQEYELAQLRTHAQGLATIHRRATAHTHPADLIEVIEGSDNIRNAFARLQRDAQFQVRGFDRPPYVSEDSNNEAQQLETTNVVYRVVYDRSALTIPGRMGDIWKGIHAGEQARVGDVPMKMVLCDDRAALIPAIDSDAAYLIYRSSLLDAMRTLFDAVWDRSIALNRTSDADAPPQLREQDRDLTRLLAAGHTDESIARALGWNVRTVRRHIQHLSEHAGARTRFQLGMQAVRKDWL